MDELREFHIIGTKALKSTLKDALNALKALKYDPAQAKRRMQRAERHAHAHLRKIIQLGRGAIQ